MAKKKEAYKHGKTLGISGREMFLFNPELVAGDDEDEEGGGVVQIVQEPSEEDKEEGAAAVDLTNFAMSAEGSGDTVKSEGEASCEAGESAMGGVVLLSELIFAVLWKKFFLTVKAIEQSSLITHSTCFECNLAISKCKLPITQWPSSWVDK